MIFHFCTMSPYVSKFIDFLKKNINYFEPNSHHFIVIDNDKFQANHEKCHDFQYSYIHSKWGFIKVLSHIKKTDSLIIHGLTNPRLFIYLYYFNRELIKRSIWSIWGGDVYFYKFAYKCLKYRFFEYLRKRIIPAIPVITSLVKGDYDIVREIYGTDAKYVYSYYPIPIDNILLKNLCNDNTENTNTVFIGNSGDPSNNHIEVLQHLKRLKENDIRIMCPLSYGDRNYIEKVIEYGKEVFGDKFIPLTDFIPPIYYSKILMKVNIAIMNHNRQQGLGSIINLLLLKKKVFIRSDTTSFVFFRDNGIKVFDTLYLDKLSLQELFYMEEKTANKNQQLIADIFSNEEAVRGWSNVFLECKTSSRGRT